MLNCSKSVFSILTFSISDCVCVKDATNEKKSKKKKRKSEAEPSKAQSSDSKDRIRIEHLNYKVRLAYLDLCIVVVLLTPYIPHSD